MPGKKPSAGEQSPVRLSTWDDEGAEKSLEAEAFSSPPN